jgi:hypothetical protein
MKKLFAILTLLFACLVQAQTGIVYKYTDSARDGYLVTDIKVGPSRTFSVISGGTFTVASGATFNGPANYFSWASVSKTGASLADIPTRLWSDLQSKPTSIAGLGVLNGATLDTIAAKTQTGTGNLVLGTSPTLTTPILGAATATSVTGPTTTDLTLQGGSSGASLVLGQGASGAATIISKSASNVNVVVDGGGSLYTSRATGSGLYIDPASSSVLNLSASTNIGFRIGASEYARLTSTGNLLIGTTSDMSASGGLKVAGTTAATNTTSGAVQIGSNIGLSGNAGGASYFGGQIDLGAGTTSANALRWSTDTAAFRSAQGNITFASTGTNPALVLRDSVNDSAYFYSSSGNVTLGSTQASKSLTLITANSTAVTIAAGGNTNFVATTSASSSTVGALTIGNGTAATNVAIGGGTVWAGAGFRAGTATDFVDSNTSSGFYLKSPTDSATIRAGVRLESALSSGSTLPAIQWYGSGLQTMAQIYPTRTAGSFATKLGFQTAQAGGTLTTGLEISEAQEVKVPASLASTGIGTGALQVTGGIYAGAANYFGGATTVTVGNAYPLTLTHNNGGAIGSIYVKNLSTSGYSGMDFVDASAVAQGTLFYSGSASAANSNSIGLIASGGTNSLRLGAGGATVITVSPAGLVNTTTATDSTNKTTGSVTLAGGLGVTKNIVTGTGLGVWDANPSAGWYGLTIGSITSGANQYGVTDQNGTYTPNAAGTEIMSYRAYASLALGAANTITNWYGFNSTLNSKTGAAVLTNAYAFYANSPTAATNNYAFYSAGTAPSSFGGALTVTGDITGNSTLSIAGGVRLAGAVNSNGQFGSKTAGSSYYFGNFANAAGSSAGISRTGLVLLSWSDATTMATATGGLVSTSPADGIGYGAGAGGTVTQITSRSTGVTLNKVSGAITLFTAAGSATATTFTVTNSAVAATDTIVLSVKSSTNKYLAFVTAVAAGSFEITFYTTGGTASDAPVINFAVLKAVSS